jgi:hypothetical protein
MAASYLSSLYPHGAGIGANVRERRPAALKTSREAHGISNEGGAPAISFRDPGTLGARAINTSVLPSTSRIRASPSSSRDESAILSKGDTVLVAGATGGVGQLLCAKLLEKGYRVLALTRDEEKTRALLGSNVDNLSIVTGDLRSKDSLARIDWTNVSAVCCCTGTTAFPSKRWDNDNTPEQTDYVANKNLIEAASRAPGLKRFVLCTSAGVERSGQFPFIILNLFGVLKYKRMAEQLLEASGLRYTIIRPNRLCDGPYTSYDLNTLLKGVAGERQDIILTRNDDQVGETSRIAVAESMVQCLTSGACVDATFSIGSVKLQGDDSNAPGTDQGKWHKLFEAVLRV